MIKKLVIMSLVVSTMILAGCGMIDRKTASLLGKPSETCYDGVIYLQFTSGASVKYLPNGSIATCK